LRPVRALGRKENANQNQVILATITGTLVLILITTLLHKKDTDIIKQEINQNDYHLLLGRRWIFDLEKTVRNGKCVVHGGYNYICTELDCGLCFSYGNRRNQVKLTQDDFERHIQAMWPNVYAILGYSYAMSCINREWHQDCMFLADVLVEKEKLA